ncbi:MAG: efflux RND transporter periplasmic adaptor subunit [Flavobacteriales bacterium]|nr:efflux RND transporter periplasmic adaptor subunit [Flavobacteriales bacterium]
MKKQNIYIATLCILLSSCGQEESNNSSKSVQLKDLKSQLVELTNEIKKLETDLKPATELPIENKIPVRIDTLKEEVFYHYIEQPGKINSKENILVSAEMGGLITQINVKEGQAVQKGQTIIELDSDIMQSNVEELKASLELAKTTFERQETLWNKKIGSELQYLQIKNQYESLQKKLDAAETQLKKLNISAPIHGVIEELFLNTGELANPGRPAFRIVNTERVYVESDVAERYANALQKNSPVKVKFDALGIQKESSLSFVGQVINPENSTFKIKIELDNPKGYLKPNGTVSLEIQDYVNKKSLVVPSQIVKKDMRGDYLFINKNGKAEKLYVEMGLSQDDKSMISSGLNVGDEIIVEGYSEVVSGSLLDIKK